MLSKNLRFFVVKYYLKPIRRLFQRTPRRLFLLSVPIVCKASSSQIPLVVQKVGKSVNKPPAEAKSLLGKTIYILRLVLRIIQLAWIWLRFTIQVFLLRSNFSSSLLNSIEDSGSIFVKLGQWASTRRDLFSPEIIQTLSKLQRNVRTSHPWSYTQNLLSQRFEPNTFAHIDPNPIGIGCCAQVYEGILSSTRKKVAIKVLHPFIKDKFHSDLFFLSKMSAFLEWLVPDLVWLSSGEFIKDFSGSMMKQMDLSLEATNLRTFINNFSEDPHVQFPKPLDGMVFQDVLVEEFLEGTDIFSMLQGDENIRKKYLAKKGVDVFFRMLFVDNFVHGDLHPGNILVTKDGLAVLDPGIATALSEGDLKNFRSVFEAVIKGDGEVVGRLFLERSTHECDDPEGFVSDINRIVEGAIRDGELSLGRVEVSKLLNSVFDTFRNHRVMLDSNFSMVIISIIIIEGIGKSLDPDLNLLTSALPYFR